MMPLMDNQIRNIRLSGSPSTSLFYLSAFLSVYNTIPNRILVDRTTLSTNRNILIDSILELEPDNTEYYPTISCETRFGGGAFQHKRWLAPRYLFRDKLLRPVARNIEADKYDLVAATDVVFWSFASEYYKEQIEKAISYILKCDTSGKSKDDIKVLVLVEQNPSKDLLELLSDYDVKYVELKDKWSIMFHAKNLLVLPEGLLTYWAGYLGYHEHVFITTYGWMCDGHTSTDMTSYAHLRDLIFEDAIAIVADDVERSDN